MCATRENSRFLCDNYNMDTAESLRQNREERGMTPHELAKAIGVNHQNIYRWESGKTQPSLEMCIKLADYFGVSLDELVGRNNY